MNESMCERPVKGMANDAASIETNILAAGNPLFNDILQE